MTETSPIVPPIATPLLALLLACGDSGTHAGDASSEGGTAATTSFTATTTDASTSTGAQDTTTGGESSTGEPQPDPPWDPPIREPPCSVDDDPALLVDALAQAGLALDQFHFTEADFAESSQYQNGVLGGDFAFSWLWDTRAEAARAGCFEGRVAGGLDHAADSAHPVANAIRHAAMLVDRPPDDATPLGPGDGFEAALAELCETVVSPCDDARGELPADLAFAVAPIIRALNEGILARLAMDAGPGGDPSFWHAEGGNLALLANGPAPQADDADTRAYMLGLGARARLYRAAAQLAFAVEHTDWSSFAGREGVDYTLATNAGAITVRGGGTDVYDDSDEAVLLLVDLGGDDEHLDRVASNIGPANPVSVAIDLDGADVYHYPEVPHRYDQAGLLVADVDGRAPADGMYGNYTLSDRFRQGAARNGIAMLFDYGGDDDSYASLRGSQGYAHLGVGVLADDGGNDTYVAEANAQGSAQLGIAILFDRGGDDSYRAFTESQGFGFTGGAGVLVDVAGTDRYDCDVGDPMYGGLPVYYSPQRPGTGNTSMCQGAGFGRRNDTSPLSSLSGGLGVLRDRAGDDEYDASLFAQGTGYWEGVGLLADGAGHDAYDAFWYVQGGVAHYAVGILADDGDGNDAYDLERPTSNVTLAGGHDFSLGVLIDDGGSDRYNIISLSAGASNCNGIGLFVDNGGDDEYVAFSELSSGLGNISAECLAARPDAVSIGIMIDAGGVDSYTYPAMPNPDFVVPSEGGLWGWEPAMLPTEHGGGLDGEGPSGVHPEAGG
jgi:hypothetical protein